MYVSAASREMSLKTPKQNHAKSPRILQSSKKYFHFKNAK